MHVPFVDLKAQYQTIKSEIDRAIASVIDESAFIRGKYVAAFEEQYARAYGIKHCISVANGTDAIYIVLRMLGIGPGDEVITTSNSWIASSETISQAGAKPVFVDVEEDYFNLDPAGVESKITSRTKAVLAVHLLGQPANIEAIRAICDRHGLYLIEDCAQAHFAEYKGRRVGTWGIAATFSFYPGKNLGAYGDAGAILTQDDGLAEKCRTYARHGAHSTNKHEHIMEGINSRMDGLQAAILSVKLPHIHEWNRLRAEHAARYTSLFRGEERVRMPKTRPDAAHIFHAYVIRVQNRDGLQAHLTQNGVQTSIHYPTPLPFLKAYEYLHHKPEDFPIVLRQSKEILSLPMYPEMTGEMQERVASLVRTWVSK